MEFWVWLQNTDQGIFLLLLSFASSIFLPIGPEIALVPILLVNHHKLLPYAACCTVGSVLGLMLTYALSYYCGQTLLERFVSQNKINLGIRVFNSYGPFALVVASVFPVFPYRILVLLSGFLRQKPWTVFSLLTVGKTLRFFGYGFLVAKLGESVVKYLI